ncbi:hypothetical protein FB567DRAFT_478286 [Paraphoma chrysanthemicola]|uniref:Fungal N-terminal domain-containing protein n=1 Tax=Paraphoma chrysanthemicola TaxID=798071 RepID=A0A8K0QY07_9PLEO|nr:hypothetical protein FB567DRAFT_478286 [Paraphoma chrysanthemicola]
MSFGFSPADVVKLIEISTRVYIAFKDANENSEAQVEGLVREFQTFAQCLLELDELMKDYGKPLPFPIENFKKTLAKCDASLRPYQENLVDKRMGFSKMMWTIKYIGKQNELEGLRRQITGHFQALNMCLSALHLRHSLETTKREQRLLLEPRHRAMSVGSPWYTPHDLATSSQISPLALPESEDQSSLYKDWKMFNRCIREQDDHEIPRHKQEGDDILGRSSADARLRDVQTADALHRLRCEVEDALVFVENREKRSAGERHTHLAPSDAMKQQVREMQPVPRPRAYTVDTESSIEFNAFPGRMNLDNSPLTVQPSRNTPSPKASPCGSPQIEQDFFNSGGWTNSPTSTSLSPGPWRSSISTIRSSMSISSDPTLSPGLGIDIHTADTTPEVTLSPTLRTVLSSISLRSLVLGEGALHWSKLCRKVQVERISISRVGSKENVVSESQDCDLHWRYRDDAGISLRASYRSKRDGKARVWIIQDFPSTGPSIPRTTTIDGEISVDFPRSSYGKLDKQWKDIRYTFQDSDSSAAFQTLLYTGNEKNPAELLFDRPVRRISSDRNRPACRGRNLRLWRRSETRLDSTGPLTYDVLILLFFTSVLEEKGHWVEEPHYAFEWMPESVYARRSDELRLVFSREASKWASDKVFQRRTSSQSVASGDAVPVSPIDAQRRDSMEPPGIPRSGTDSSLAVPAKFTNPALRGKRAASGLGRMNRFGYTKLDIDFHTTKDRANFLEVWRKYAKPLGTTL